MIERTFAVLTVHHGLTQARYLGPATVTNQAVMTGFLVNCKRLVRLMNHVGAQRERVAGVGVGRYEQITAIRPPYP